MSHRTVDTWLISACRLSATVSALVLLVIVVFVVAEALEAVETIGLNRFIFDASWHPLSGAYGMTPMIAGTLFSSILAVAIATPIGIAVAIVEQFYLAGGRSLALRRMVEILSGIPSVVVGLWGLTVIVPLLATINPPGTSLMAAAIVLALMQIPTIAYFSSLAFERSGTGLRQASLALGLSRRTLILNVVMPPAVGGIAAGVILALSRAVGETMMVLMVAGNVPGFPNSLLAPIRTLTANMALEMAYAEGLHRSALFLSGALVMVVALLLVLSARPFVEGERDHA